MYIVAVGGKTMTNLYIIVIKKETHGNLSKREITLKLLSIFQPRRKCIKIKYNKNIL